MFKKARREDILLLSKVNKEIMSIKPNPHLHSAAVVEILIPRKLIGVSKIRWWR
jgi:hypothetical protein